jgi:dTDP-glucose 4,6-dehydratase
MRVFVTGGAGFIGSNFIRSALAINPSCEIVNFDKLTYAGNLDNLKSIERNRRYSFVHGDVCDSRAVMKAMEVCDAVINFAAESHVDRSIYEPEPAVRTNVLGTSVLLRAARKHRISQFVQISTDEVYGDIPAGKKADENWAPQPNSPYSASKASADLLVRSFARTYDFPAVIVRMSNCYGPFQFPEKFLPLIILNTLEGKPLPIFGDGKQQRDWLHVDDACGAVMLALTHGKSGEIYNFGGGNLRQNLDLAKFVLNYLKDSKSRITHVEDRPGHDRRYALDSRKAARELGWKPSIPIETGLRETIEWYRANRKWWKKAISGEYRKFHTKYYGHRTKSLKEI